MRHQTFKSVLSLFFLMFLFLSIIPVQAQSSFILSKEIESEFKKASKLEEVFKTAQQLSMEERYVFFKADLTLLSNLLSAKASLEKLKQILSYSWLPENHRSRIQDFLINQIIKEKVNPEKKPSSLVTLKSGIDFLSSQNTEIKDVGIFQQNLRAVYNLVGQIPDHYQEKALKIIDECHDFKSKSLLRRLNNLNSKLKEAQKLQDHTLNNTTSEIDYDGFYVETGPNEFVRVSPSVAQYCHFVTKAYGTGFFNYPKRWFTVENHLVVVEKANKLILKGPKFNSSTLAKAELLEMEKLRSSMPFFHCGNYLYKNGETVYMGKQDKNRKPIPNPHKSKRIGLDHHEYHFLQPLSAGIYALYVDKQYYIFQIK